MATPNAALLSKTVDAAIKAIRDGADANINGTLDEFIEAFAKYQAHVAWSSELDYLDYELYDSLSVNEFGMMCMAYGIWECHIGPNARDWFVKKYKERLMKLQGWEGGDSECL